jgi:Na+-transporting methylmalonyl-CoA/oxaloacetate decarboxylase gamma subunit
MKVLGNGFVFSLLAAAILAFATAEVSAAFVKKEELDRGDVEAPVEAAVEDLAGDQVALNRIVAVYQPTQTNLKENSKTVQNIALIYASLSGSIPQPGGVPFVYDDDIEQIFCLQATNDRWMCSFSVLGSLVGTPGVNSLFFLEE